MELKGQKRRKYRFEEELGSGGMGTVWRARDEELGRAAAVKVITTPTAEALKRFETEAKATATAAEQSAHIVQIYDYWTEEGHPFIAMELLRGESLGDRLARGGRLGPVEGLRILEQVCKGIKTAHEHGIVHRDLKPDNIFLAKKDNEDVAKVLDFGIARFRPANVTLAKSQTQTGTVLGSYPYMSPEQLEGATSETDERMDVWALGVIAFECLVGRRPFPSEVPARLAIQILSDPLPVPSTRNPDLPKAFDAWFAKAVNRDLASRYQSVQELSDDLKRALAEPGIGTTRPSGSPPMPSAKANYIAATLAERSPIVATLPEDVRNTQNEISTTVRAQANRKSVPGWVVLGAGVVFVGGVAWVAITKFISKNEPATSSELEPPASVAPASPAAPVSSPAAVAVAPAAASASASPPAGAAPAVMPVASATATSGTPKPAGGSKHVTPAASAPRPSVSAKPKPSSVAAAPPAAPAPAPAPKPAAPAPKPAPKPPEDLSF